MPEILTEGIRKVLKREFAALTADVELLVFTRKGLNDKFNEITVGLCRELEALSGKIHFKHREADGGEAERYGVTTSPVVLLNPDRYRIQFMGAPVGEEMRSLVLAIRMVSQGRGVLSGASAAKLKGLKEQREVMVFVSPTCPYCPQQAVYAVSAAVEAPEAVSVKVVEIYENRELAERYSVVSVPQTVVNGEVIGVGLQEEGVFVDSLLKGVRPREGPAPPEEVVKKDLVIVGAGPAGLTAAIYAERSGLSTVVLERGNIGGQVALTPVVENYPGYTRIAGKTLVDLMAEQALQYAEIHQGEGVSDIERTGEGLFRVVTDSAVYLAKAVILATGAEHKRLGVPGEKRFFGRGVSYCATCDGYFFKDGKKVVLVGGGNTAVTEVLYLDSIGVDVTLIHRRDRLRAEERLQQSLRERRIPILWNTVVEEILGDTVVNAVKIRNLKDDRTSVMPVDGVFVAIGYEPLNELARKLGLELTGEGYIKVDERQRTSMKGVYAAGDITGGIKQIVTAVGQGSIAAITAFEDLMNPYWKKD